MTRYSPIFKDGAIDFVSPWGRGLPSQALTNWMGERSARLDELETAHQAVGGTAPGRRYTTRQLNHAYTTAIAAEFQGYVRALYTEAALKIAAVVPLPLQGVIVSAFSKNRALDRGNANEKTLKDDFGRLGLVDFWNDLGLGPSSLPKRRRRLEQLNIWRNAIAHSNFNFSPDQVKTLGGTTADLLVDVRAWRRNCNLLARRLDAAVSSHLANVVGQAPWT